MSKCELDFFFASNISKIVFFVGGIYWRKDSYLRKLVEREIVVEKKVFKLRLLLLNRHIFTYFQSGL